MKRSLSVFLLLFAMLESFVWSAAAANKSVYEDAIVTARREIWKNVTTA